MPTLVTSNFDDDLVNDEQAMGIYTEPQKKRNGWGYTKYIIIRKYTIQIINNDFIVFHLGDNCIQICHLGRYIVGYTVGNFVLRRRVSGAVKHNFRTYIRRYTTPNDKLEYGYPHSNVLFNINTSQPGICLKNISCVSDV